ncbi:MAG: 50S ribosomal protein L11 methyltransferase [Flavobacteriales bacterium]|nr:50S ribosomal protein L11 methyltransferase [Flavobacteriales bacterium]
MSTTWTEVDLLLAPTEPWRDILLVELEGIGYEAFEETTGGLKAYIATSHYDRSALAGLSVMHTPGVKVNFSVRPLPDINWNQEWEKNFQPVRVGQDVLIRADFHEPDPKVRYELVITPKMAFGTGHHATTRAMVRAMLGLDLAGRAVCDLGCGTGVLAILAARMGARPVLAVDNDGQAVLNAEENVRVAACHDIAVEKGDAALLGTEKWDAILANIERNTLLRDMPALVNALRPGGHLLLSGFLSGDVPRMEEGAQAAGARPVEVLHENEWAMLLCQRS